MSGGRGGAGAGKGVFDGIDIDWEYPGGGGMPYNTFSPADKQNYNLLMQEFRRQLDVQGAADGKRYLLTAAIGAGQDKIDNTEPAVYSQSMDWINVMTYDMSGAWPGWESWHHSALSGATANHPTSIESSVKSYINAGVSRNKLGIGVPFYGRCWQGVDKPGEAGGTTNGPMSYRLIHQDYYDKDNLEWDSTAKASYLSFDDPEGPDNCEFITYAEARDMTERAKFIEKEKLGGSIVWSIGQAHMDKNSRAKRHPLLKALWEGLK